ncbi:D-lactaldehyde dehydrogenase [Mycena floridula]|nr:D-lactaldehyde dehydrogenase [Mycena floridula]
MPVVPAGSKILVSGASGYIAAWVVRTLLEKGYSVRGTVRSAAKGNFLKETFASYGDKFEFVLVEDIEKDGAFDEAVKDVDAIEHTASPFHYRVNDPQDLIGPAVQGTVGILQSVVKNGSKVKRIVVTSSCASVLSIHDEPKVFSESDWNEQAIKQVEELGKSAPAQVVYRASKTLAEKAAWAFVEKNKAEIGWDLVVLNPPFVFGPFIHQVDKPESLNTSAHAWYNTLLTENMGGLSVEALRTTGSCWIDVRDLAEAHARALDTEAASGERIIISAGPFVWQEWLDVANSLEPSPIPSRKISKGAPTSAAISHKINYNTSKGLKIFGIKYRTREELARDTLEDFERRGW